MTAETKKLLLDVREAGESILQHTSGQTHSDILRTASSAAPSSASLNFMNLITAPPFITKATVKFGDGSKQILKTRSPEMPVVGEGVRNAHPPHHDE